MLKPDYSGEWTLNVGASALSPVVAPVVESGFVRTDHHEPTIAVHLSITMDGKPFINWKILAVAFVPRNGCGVLESKTMCGYSTERFRAEISRSRRGTTVALRP